MAAYQSYVNRTVIALFTRDHIRYHIHGVLESVIDGEFKFTSGRVDEVHLKNGTQGSMDARTFPNRDQVYTQFSFERHQLVTIAEEPK